MDMRGFITISRIEEETICPDPQNCRHYSTFILPVFASRLAMAGVDPLTKQQLGGWKTLQMVLRYAHLSPDHKRAALGRLISYRTDTTTGTRQETRIGTIQADNGKYTRELVPGAGVEPA